MKGRLRSAFPSEEGHRKRNQILIEKGSNPSRRKSLCHQRVQPIYAVQRSSTNKRPARRRSQSPPRSIAKNCQTSAIRKSTMADRPAPITKKILLSSALGGASSVVKDGRKPDHHR